MAREIAGKVFFAAKGQLNGRAAHLIGNCSADIHVFKLQPMTKAATCILVVQDHLLRIMPGDASHLLLQKAGHLMRGPDLHFVRVHTDDRAQRFQGLVRHVRRAVFGLQCALTNRLRNIAIGPPLSVQIVLNIRRLKCRPMPGLFCRIGGCVPFYLNRLCGLKGAPSVVGNHRQTKGHLKHLSHTAHGFGLGCIIGFDRAAPGAEPHSGVHHALYRQINPVIQRACGFGDDIHTFRRLSNQAPRCSLTQRHVLNRINPRRRTCQFGVRHRRAIRQHNRAALRFERGNVNAMHLSRRCLQCLTRGCPCSA